jgi:hypothetical protein
LHCGSVLEPALQHGARALWRRPVPLRRKGRAAYSMNWITGCRIMPFRHLVAPPRIIPGGISLTINELELGQTVSSRMPPSTS